MPSKITVSRVKSTSQWALAESDFASGLVGGKSLNLAAMRKQLSGSASLPVSIAIPFGSFERVLSDRLNGAASQEIASLTKALERAGSQQSKGVPAELQKLRQLVRTKLQCPSELQQQVLYDQSNNHILTSHICLHHVIILISDP